MKKAIAATLGCLIISGCSEQCGANLESHLKANGKIGGSADYWLVKNNVLGQAERVGLIFGYADDSLACGDTASILNVRYSAANFRCEPVVK